MVALAIAPVANAANNPDVTLDNYVAARLAEISQENGQAQAGYSKLLSKVPNSATLADRLFASAIRSGDMANAIKAIRAQELQNKASSEAPLLLFADAFRRKNWAMAKLANAELAARTQYGFLTPLLNAWLAVAQRSSVDFEVLKDNKDQALSYFALPQRVYLKLAIEKIDVAKAELRSLQSLDSDFIQDLNLRSASIFAAKGDVEFAKALVSKALDGDVGSIGAGSKPASRLQANEGLAALHLHVANSLLVQKQPETALIFARIAEFYAPNDVATQSTIGAVMVALNASKTAQKIFNAIPESSPYWSQGVAAIVRGYSKERKFAEAATLIAKARRQRPKMVSLALLAAQNFEELNNLEAAANVYRELSESADRSKTAPGQAAIFRMFLANVVEKQGDWATAKNLLQTALQLDPTNAYILNSLGYSMLEHKEDPTLAIELLKKARGLAPDSAAIADSLGWAYVQSGALGQAIPLLELAVKKSGNDLTINEHLGDAYWLVGRKVAARYAWQVAMLSADGEANTRLLKKIDLGIETKKAVGRP